MVEEDTICYYTLSIILFITFVSFTVRPLEINLTGVEKYVVQGTNVKLECVVRGARPAASIRWANGTYEIDEDDLVTSKTGEVRFNVIFISTFCYTCKKMYSHSNQFPEVP